MQAINSLNTTSPAGLVWSPSNAKFLHFSGQSQSSKTSNQGTMKYTALAVVAIATFADAASSINQDTIERSLKQVDKKKLLRNARELNGNMYYAYNANGKNVNYQYQSQSQYQYNQYQQQKQKNNQNYGNNQYYDFQIDGTFSLRFETCASMTILDDTVKQDAQSGYVYHTAKDFVVFKATNNKKVEKTFAIDIPTFVNTLAETVLSENYNYCQLCYEAIDTCMYWTPGDSSSSQQIQQGGNQYGYQMANGANRRLEDADMEPIDCGTCKKVCGEQMSAYNYNSQYTDESAMGWLQTISQCTQLSYDDGYMLGNLQYGNYLNANGYNAAYSNNNNNNANNNYQQSYNQVYGQIYAGLMCNADGSGIEIGLFKDEDCTIWDPVDTFKSTLQAGTEPYIYYTKTKDLVEYVFQANVSCRDTQYYNPYGNSNNNNNYYQYNKNGNKNNAYQVPQANEGCQDLFGGGYTIDLSSGDCGNGAQNSAYSYNGQSLADGSIYGEYTFYGSSGKQTYSYDITDVDDQYQICTSLGKQLAKGTTHTTNTQSKNNNLYQYKNNLSVGSRIQENLSGDDIFLIILGVLFGVAAVFFSYKAHLIRKCSNRDKRQALISAGDLS